MGPHFSTTFQLTKSSDVVLVDNDLYCRSRERLSGARNQHSLGDMGTIGDILG